ncbi:hypothetical protein FOZ63_012113, partial [Perkinsus olseni]
MKLSIPIPKFTSAGGSPNESPDVSPRTIEDSEELRLEILKGTRGFAKYIPKRTLLRVARGDIMRRVVSDDPTGCILELEVEGPSSWFLVALRDSFNNSKPLRSKLITGVGLGPFTQSLTVRLQPAATIGYSIDLPALRNELGEALYFLVVSRVVLCKAATLPVTCLMPMGLLGKGTFGAVKRVKVAHSEDSGDMAVDMAL